MPPSKNVGRVLSCTAQSAGDRLPLVASVTFAVAGQICPHLAGLMRSHYSPWKCHGPSAKPLAEDSSARLKRLQRGRKHVCLVRSEQICCHREDEWVKGVPSKEPWISHREKGISMVTKTTLSTGQSGPLRLYLAAMTDRVLWQTNHWVFETQLY